MDELNGFYTDPWAGGTTGLLYDSPALAPDTSSLWSIDTSAPYQAPSTGLYDVSAQSVGPSPFEGWSISASTANDWLKTGQTAIDYGLKVFGALTNARNTAQDHALSSYLKQAQFDLAKTQAFAAADVAKINATSAAKFAQARANLGSTVGTATNLGAAVGNNSLMLWLTVAGLALAFIQVVNTSK